MRLCYSPAFACLLFLQSCVFSSQPAPPPEPQLSPVASFLRDAVPGEAKEMDDPAFGGPVAVRFEEEFTSAAGEQCRRERNAAHLNALLFHVYPSFLVLLLKR